MCARRGCEPGSTSSTGVTCAAGKYSSGVMEAWAGGAGPPCSLCPPGSYSAEGAAACAQCPAGSYSLIGLCELCPEGRWGDAGGTAVTCAGPCVAGAGSGCPAGSAHPNGAPCPRGRYNDQPAISTGCAPCPAGRYGVTVGERLASCSGECTPAPGRSCVAGSAHPHGTPCPAGRFTSTGVLPCAPCAEGKFSYPGANACRERVDFTMEDDGGVPRCVPPVVVCVQGTCFLLLAF